MPIPQSATTSTWRLGKPCKLFSSRWEGREVSRSFLPDNIQDYCARLGRRVSFFSEIDSLRLTVFSSQERRQLKGRTRNSGGHQSQPEQLSESFIWIAAAKNLFHRTVAQSRPRS